MHLLIKLAGGVPWGGPLWGKLQSGRVREEERDSHLSRCVGPLLFGLHFGSILIVLTVPMLRN